MAAGLRIETIALHAEQKAAAIAVLDRHPCVDPASVRWSGTMLTFGVDLALVPNGDGPAVCEVIRRDILDAVRRRP